MTANHLQKMSHGRGRGLRRTFETGDTRPGGLKTRASADRESMSSADTDESSAVPDNFTITDLVQVVEQLDLEDKKSDQTRKVTKCIKHLCSNEESLR